MVRKEMKDEIERPKLNNLVFIDKIKEGKEDDILVIVRIYFSRR